MTCDKHKCAIICSELTETVESLGQMRLAVNALTEAVRELQERVGLLEVTRPHLVGSIQGHPWSMTITLPAEFETG